MTSRSDNNSFSRRSEARKDSSKSSSVAITTFDLSESSLATVAPVSPSRIYESQCGLVSEFKDGAGVIEWSTEQGIAPKIHFTAQIHHDDDQEFEEGDVVTFRAMWNSSTASWVAHHVIHSTPLEGVVYAGGDRKLFIRCGPQQIQYSLAPVDYISGCIKIRAGDKVSFHPAALTFNNVPNQVQRATHLSICAHGVIDCLVQDPKCMGIYIKWRKAEDSKGESPSEERVYHMLELPDLESKFYLPGLKCTLTPLLLIKKRTKKLNLTSKFGTFVAIGEGTVVKVPKGKQDGQVRLTKHSSTLVPFTTGEILTNTRARPLRVGDSVEVTMSGTAASGKFYTGVSVILDGTVSIPDERRYNALNNDGVVICAEDSQFDVDTTVSDAVIGFPPLRNGDRVRFQVNNAGCAQNIIILGEVEGRVYAPGIIRIRNSQISAVYAAKNNEAFKPGDNVVLRLEWKDTHYRANLIRHARNAPLSQRDSNTNVNSTPISSNTKHTAMSPQMIRSPRGFAGTNSPTQMPPVSPANTKSAERSSSASWRRSGGSPSMTRRQLFDDTPERDSFFASADPIVNVVRSPPGFSQAMYNVAPGSPLSHSGSSRGSSPSGSPPSCSPRSLSYSPPMESDVYFDEIWRRDLTLEEVASIPSSTDSSQLSDYENYEIMMQPSYDQDYPSPRSDRARPFLLHNRTTPPAISTAPGLMGFSNNNDTFFAHQAPSAGERASVSASALPFFPSNPLFSTTSSLGSTSVINSTATSNSAFNFTWPSDFAPSSTDDGSIRF